MPSVLPAFAFFLLAVTPSPAVTTQMAAHIDAAVNNALVRQHVAAVSIAIVENGEIAYAKGYGVRDISSGARADQDTVYPIGSNTKQFTAAAILLLQEQGRLSITDTLAKYVPEYPHASEITLEQLLEQVSGVPDYTQTPDYSAHFSDQTTPDQMLATIRKAPLDFKPGTAWEYSNANYMLLSMVIAKASGESYQGYVEEHLLRPFGLATAAFDTYQRSYPDEANGYTSFAMGDLRAPLHEDYTWFQGAGDLMMSASDLARWGIALNSGRVISPALFAAMTTTKLLPNGKPTGYGYGLSAGNQFLGHSMVGHLGGLAGFVSEDLMFPSEHVAVVVLGNSDSFNPIPITHDIVATMYQQTLPHHAPNVLVDTAAEKTQAHLWLERALSGSIETTVVTPDFAQSTMATPQAQASMLNDLRQLGKRAGKPKAFELISREGPPGVHAFTYDVAFAHDLIKFDYAVDPSGKLAYLNFSPVYDY